MLVGMNTEMVVHAKGKAPKKVRERDGETEYEEWIYGEPPQDVDFVRIVNDEVVRVETMRVGGQKIVRTEKEIILEKPDKDTEAKQRRSPGECAQPAAARRRLGKCPQALQWCIASSCGSAARLSSAFGKPQAPAL